MSPDNLTCEACAEYYKSIGKGTPCFPCAKPFLDEGNVETWEIFLLLSSQARVAGMGGFIGLDYSALPVIFQARQVPDYEQRFILEKIHVLSSIMVKYLNKKQ